LKDASIYITRYGIFRPFALDSPGLFGEIAPPNRTLFHEHAARLPRQERDRLAERRHRHLGGDPDRREVFGAAFAGGWALAILIGLDETGAHILQAVLFALGVLVMVAFIRAAQRVEPFTTRA
jgi:hypothetical protein